MLSSVLRNECQVEHMRNMAACHCIAESVEDVRRRGLEKPEEVHGHLVLCYGHSAVEVLAARAWWALGILICAMGGNHTNTANSKLKYWRMLKSRQARKSLALCDRQQAQHWAADVKHSPAP